MNMKEWTDVARVRSETDKNVEYTIKRSPEGTYGCSCFAWRNQKKPVGARICKHIQAYFKGDGNGMQVRAPKKDKGQEYARSKSPIYSYDEEVGF